MATTKQAAPAKKSEGFQGVRGAFWIIVVCAIIAFILFFTWFGNDMHFQDPGTNEHPADIWGTIFKGGVIVPVIHTLLLSVLAMTIERWMALKTATGTGALPKFVANIKAALNANDFAKANQLCDKQKGSVANVVRASLNAYASMESGANASLKKSQKVAKIQQAHEEATQLEMPTLTMNLPIIATIVTLGTLTGLLGTVTGMIKSFSALSSGGVFLGAFFMATDYVTSPSTKLGRVIFGIGCGAITVIIRKYCNYPEGVSFAILLMNILAPHLESFTLSKSFGGAKK